MGYGYYYSTPIMHYVNSSIALIVAAVVGGLLGLVLFWTFLRKKNEGKYTGFRDKVYNFMKFKKFYV